MPIADTALGPVEYETTGEGPAVIVVHGSPGGIDQARLMAGFLPADLQAVVVSRPGYLGTELGDRRTVDQQADLHAALLDALGVDQAAVLAWSGGGPSTYRLAVRHPERVRALVVAAGVSQAIERPHEGLDERLMFHTRLGQRLLKLMGERAPKQLIAATLEAEGDLGKAELEALTDAVLADPVQRDFVVGLAQTVSERGDRKQGVDNDFAQFQAIADLELERVAAPTLIVYGSVDTDVPPAHSEHALRQIPGARARVLDRGTHLALWVHADAPAAQAEAISVLRG